MSNLALPEESQEEEKKQSIEPPIANPPKQQLFEEGYNPSHFQDPELAKKLFQCGLCQKVARKAVELSCDDHGDDEKLPIYCELCLSKYLKENNGRCPVSKNPKATYDRSRSSRREILHLNVICPNSKDQLRTWIVSHPRSILPRIVAIAWIVHGEMCPT